MRFTLRTKFNNGTASSLPITAATVDIAKQWADASLFDLDVYNLAAAELVGGGHKWQADVASVARGKVRWFRDATRTQQMPVFGSASSPEFTSMKTIITSPMRAVRTTNLPTMQSRYQ